MITRKTMWSYGVLKGALEPVGADGDWVHLDSL